MTMMMGRLGSGSQILLRRYSRRIVKDTPRQHVVPSNFAPFSTTTAADLSRIPPILTPPAIQATPGTTDTPPQKGFLGRLWAKYSFKGQQDRIHTAESLFQAATRQASDP